MKARLIFSLILIAVSLGGIGYLVAYGEGGMHVSVANKRSSPQAAGKVLQTTNDRQKAVAKPTLLHLYSPLRDPPPVVTSANLEKWVEQAHAVVDRMYQPSDLSAPLAKQYASLAARAKAGDSRAAMELANGLGSCITDFGVTEAGQRQEIEAIEEAGIGPGGYPSVKEYNAAIRNVKLKAAYCAGLTEAQKRSWKSWLQIAAQGGNADAKFQLFESASNQAEARSLLEQAALAGVPKAWEQIALQYNFPIPNAPPGLFPRDPEKSYAAWYVTYLLTGLPLYKYYVWKASQALTPLQIRQGEQLAVAKYEQIMKVRGGS